LILRRCGRNTLNHFPARDEESMRDADNPDEKAPETPLDEPSPTPIEDPPPEPGTPPYVVTGRSTRNPAGRNQMTTNLSTRGDAVTTGVKERRGFASMSREKQREIASKGGRAAHQKGTAHEWTSEEARSAGRKGGQISRGGRGRLVTPTEGTMPSDDQMIGRDGSGAE
jgi:general stress protein YciG